MIGKGLMMARYIYIPEYRYIYSKFSLFASYILLMTNAFKMVFGTCVLLDSSKKMLFSRLCLQT